ncbi:hypothetical protein M231_07907, partial [Tremella mesenterica]
MAHKAGLTAPGPAVQVRIMLRQDGKVQEWQASVFDSLFTGKWKESVQANVNEALRLGEQMWKQGKGETETGKKFEQCAPQVALLNQKGHPVALSQEYLPLTLFEFFTVYCKQNRLFLLVKDLEQTGYILVFIILNIDHVLEDKQSDTQHGKAQDRLSRLSMSR